MKDLTNSGEASSVDFGIFIMVTIYLLPGLGLDKIHKNTYRIPPTLARVHKLLATEHLSGPVVPVHQPQALHRARRLASEAKMNYNEK